MTDAILNHSHSCHHAYKYLGNQQYEVYPEQPRGFSVTVYFKDADSRDDFVAKFPKYVGVRRSALLTSTDDIIPAAQISVNFAETKGNKKNETGYKRVAKFMELAGDLGECRDGMRAVNHYGTIEGAFAAIALSMQE